MGRFLELGLKSITLFVMYGIKLEVVSMGRFLELGLKLKGVGLIVIGSLTCLNGQIPRIRIEIPSKSSQTPEKPIVSMADS